MTRSEHVQVQGSNAQSVQEPSSSNVHINGAYTSAQLQAALAAAERAAQQSDAGHGSTTAAQEAAAARVQKWTDVMSGMVTGAISIGSRQPVKGMPVWVTPEVARGGFATGKHAAGGTCGPTR